MGYSKFMDSNFSNVIITDSQIPWIPVALVAQALFQKLTGRKIPIEVLDPVVVEVHVEGDFEHELDDEVAGIYLLEVDPGLPPEKISEAALDAFHSIVRIYFADVFHYSVVMDGLVIGKTNDYGVQDFHHGAVVMGKV